MFSLILDSILSYIRRNPLTITIIVMIAVFAPSLFGAALIGLLIGALLLLIGPMILLWRLYREARRIEREGQAGGQAGGRAGGRAGGYTNGGGFSGNGGFSGSRGFSGRGFRGFYTSYGGNSANGYGRTNAEGGSCCGNSQRNPNEGEVKIYTTSEQPQKRVSDQVGDYVEFEEVKPKK